MPDLYIHSRYMVITNKTLHLSWISTIFDLDVMANNYNENLTLIINNKFYSWFLGGFLTIYPDLVLSSTFSGIDAGELCFVFGLGVMGEWTSIVDSV